jgi:hypothetical protein
MEIGRNLGYGRKSDGKLCRTYKRLEADGSDCCFGKKGWHHQVPPYKREHSGVAGLHLPGLSLLGMNFQ